jgi:hypothetical protein
VQESNSSLDRGIYPGRLASLIVCMVLGLPFLPYILFVTFWFVALAFGGGD